MFRPSERFVNNPFLFNTFQKFIRRLPQFLRIDGTGRFFESGTKCLLLNMGGGSLFI